MIGRATATGLVCLLLVGTPAHVGGAQESPDSAETRSATLPAVEAVEAVPAARAAEDERARAELQSLFDRIGALDGVRVRVEAGVAVLDGAVADVEARGQAVDLARAEGGVVFVDDRLQISSTLEERLAPTWDRLREFAVQTLARLPLLLVAGAVMALAFFLGLIARRWRGPARLVSANPFLQSLIQRAAQTVLILAGLLVSLDLLGATALVGAVAGTAGIAGLALSFAFKDIGENYLSGVLMSLRPPFDKNDHVVLGSFEGKVVRLTWRDTILMTLDGNHARIPNAEVFKGALLNYTRNPNRRFQFDFGVGPADDLARAQELGLDTLGTMSSVLADPEPRSVVVDVGDSTVTVRWMAWVDQRTSSFGRARSEAIRLVKMRLEEEGITLPSPEYLVRLQSDDSGSTGPPPPRPAPESRVEQDTSVDTAVDRQIEVDREASSEGDLLGQGPTE